MENIRLFSYKMTHDTGFAPNPFHGVLTLANCKPLMRKTKKIDDWIAGFTSKALNGDKVGKERLVYLMKVTDKITYEKYWNDSIYKSKKPDLSSYKTIDKAGDNIYKPIKKNPKFNIDFEQIKNMNHNEKDKDLDLKGENVLISNCFYYFGASPIKLEKSIRPKTPKNSSSQGVLTSEVKAEEFIKFIQNNYEAGIVNLPHKWPNENNKYIKHNIKCK